MMQHDHLESSVPAIKVVNHFFGFTVIGNLLTAAIGVVMFIISGFDFLHQFKGIDFIGVISVGTTILIKVFSLTMTFYGAINAKAVNKKLKGNDTKREDSNP